MKTAQNTTVAEMKDTADFYARNLLDYVGADNGKRFKNNSRTKRYDDSPNAYHFSLHFFNQSVLMTFDEAQRTVSARVFNGYNDVITTLSLDDYTPNNESASDYVLCA